MTADGPSRRRPLPGRARRAPLLATLLALLLAAPPAATAQGGPVVAPLPGEPAGAQVPADPAAAAPGDPVVVQDPRVPAVPPAGDAAPGAADDADAEAVDLAAEAEARLRAGIELEGVPIGTRCVTPGAQLDIAGIGRAVYDTIAIDTAAGTARLAGGVCIEVPGADLVLRAFSVEIRNLPLDGGDAEGTPAIEASQARLDVGAWRLSVSSLAGTIEDLALRDIVLRSPGVVGRATNGRVGSGEAGFEAVLRRVALATHDYRLDARVARLVGDVLVLEEAAGTTCVCGAPRFVLLSDSVRADLADGGDFVVRDPVLRVLGVEIPLVNDLSLGEEGPTLELPFAVTGRENVGTIAIVRGRHEPGVRVELGAATHPEPWPLAVLVAEAPGDRLRLEVDGRGVLLDARRQRDVGGGAWVAGLSETVLRGDEPRLRAGAELGWSGRLEHAPTSGPTLTTTLSARAGAEVAVEPAGVADDERPAGTGAAAPRLPFQAQLRTGADLGGGVRADLTGSFTAAAYPGVPGAGRLAVNVAPSVTIAGRDARLVLGAQRRWTAGEGPFEFDEVSPRARLRAEAVANVGAFHADARVVWRFAPEGPGAEDLRLRADVDVPLGGGWTLTPALRAELAGLAGGPGDEDWLEAEVAARHGEDTRVALRAREGLDPLALRDLVLSAETPIVLTPSLRVVPHLAIDVAPWLAGGGPELYGHGLRLYIDDCCGTFVVGYRATDGEWTVEVDLRLPPLDLGEPPLPESALQDVPLLLAPAPGGGAPGGPVPAVPGPGGPGGPVPLPEPPGGDPSRAPELAPEPDPEPEPGAPGGDPSRAPDVEPDPEPEPDPDPAASARYGGRP